MVLETAFKSSLLTWPTWGISISSAVSGPTCPVSESALLRPQMIKSGASFFNARDNALAVAKVSDPASARSVSRMARSAPNARHSSNPSRAWGGPMHNATTWSPGALFNSTARTRPSMSKGLTSEGTPSLMMVLFS